MKIIYEFEQQLAILHSEKANLLSYKESFPYILKEILKWMQNKSNTLRHSLRNLNDEDLNEIKDAFREAGINYNF